MVVKARKASGDGFRASDPDGRGCDRAKNQKRHGNAMVVVRVYGRASSRPRAITVDGEAIIRLLHVDAASL